MWHIISGVVDQIPSNTTKNAENTWNMSPKIRSRPLFAQYLVPPPDLNPTPGEIIHDGLFWIYRARCTFGTRVLENSWSWSCALVCRMNCWVGSHSSRNQKMDPEVHDLKANFLLRNSSSFIASVQDACPLLNLASSQKGFMLGCPLYITSHHSRHHS